MAPQKEKPLSYWIALATALSTLIGLVAAGTTRLNAVELKASRVPAVEWDLRIIKAILRSYNPAKYDSVITTEIQLNGQRPEIKE